MAARMPCSDTDQLTTAEHLLISLLLADNVVAQQLFLG